MHAGFGLMLDFAARQRVPALSVWTFLALVAGTEAGCASSPEPEVKVARAPFIRRAQRQTALVLGWPEEPLGAGDREALARTLSRKLRSTYRTPVTVLDLSTPWNGLDPTTLARFARAGIDDAVVVETAAAEEDGGLRGRARVIALATQDVLHDFELSAPALAPAAERIQRWADAIYLGLSRRWTAPGDAPEMVPLEAANRLFDRNACAHAVKLYDIALASDRAPQRSDLIARHTRALERRRQCRVRLEREAVILADQSASFELRMEVGEVSGTLASAVRSAVEGSELKRLLGRRTDKPVVLRLEPRRLVLELRHHPGRPGQPKLEEASSGAAVLDLSPLRPVLDALVGAKLTAADRLDGDAAAILRASTYQLVLTHLPDEELRFELTDLAGRALLGPDAVAKRGTTQSKIRTRDLTELRDLRFVLGPIREARQGLSRDALAVQMMGGAALPASEARTTPRLALPRLPGHAEL